MTTSAARSRTPQPIEDCLVDIPGLTSKLDYLSTEDLEKVRQAYRFADEAHLGQLRSNGDPYITHPIAVAVQCAEWKIDAQALMAALLHEALEDCGVPKAELTERFGSPVVELVDGLTKLDKLQFNSQEENQAESFRKMLLVMVRDVRVILIKVADRMHNMRTLGNLPRSKWGRIASETLDIYAPIAHRLGLNQTYRELQDLSFRYLRPWRYTVLSKAMAKARSRRPDLCQKVQKELEGALAAAGISAHIKGHEKALYAIYQEMESKHLSFAQVTDTYGFRVILPQVIDCYTALGVIHQDFKPLPGKIKDHIAIAKPNSYQSLHTTLVGPSNVNVELQIRTAAMHLVAEFGVAAHWLTKVNKPDAALSNRLGNKWLQFLLSIQDETRDAAGFWDQVKVDLFPDAVYIFTPKSQIMAMPRGSTIVDFAYSIHSNVGDRTVSARINDEQVPLCTELKNGDKVEVVTEPTATPNPTWLSFVHTGRARSKIRQYLKTMAHTDSEELPMTLAGHVSAGQSSTVKALISPEELRGGAGSWFAQSGSVGDVLGKVEVFELSGKRVQTTSAVDMPNECIGSVRLDVSAISPAHDQWLSLALIVRFEGNWYAVDLEVIEDDIQDDVMWLWSDAASVGPWSMGALRSAFASAKWVYRLAGLGVFVAGSVDLDSTRAGV